MLVNRIIDADGCRIIVNEHDLRVSDRLYRMHQVSGYGIRVQKPDRLPGLTLTLAGMLVMCFVSNLVFFWLGFLITSLGITSMLIAKRRYSMRISTSLGDKDVLISEKKENINRIVEAIDEVRWLKVVRDSQPAT
jgi:hypothetical protein